MQTHLQTAYHCTLQLTNYAQAALTAIPKLKQPPDWFRSVQPHIADAQQHANEWKYELCPQSTVTLPQGILAYNSTFQTVSQQLLTLLQDIEASPGGEPSSEQQLYGNAKFTQLVDALTKQQQAVKQLEQQLAAFHQDIVEDHLVLSEDVIEAQTHFAEGHSWVNIIKQQLTTDYLDCQQLGPCRSIVQIKMDININIQGTGADPTVITIVFIQTFLKQLVQEQEQLAPALQGMLVMWGTVNNKYAAVLADLKQAQGEAYTHILKQIDLETARQQWAQLAAFTEQLYGTSNRTGGISC